MGLKEKYGMQESILTEEEIEHYITRARERQIKELEFYLPTKSVKISFFLNQFFSFFLR